MESLLCMAYKMARAIDLFLLKRLQAFLLLWQQLFLVSSAQHTERFVSKFETNDVTVEGPRSSVGQPKMKYWKLHELHNNEVKMCIPYEQYAQKFGNVQF